MQSEGAVRRELQGAGGGVGVLQYIVYIGYIICLLQLIGLVHNSRLPANQEKENFITGLQITVVLW